MVDIYLLISGIILGIVFPGMFVYSFLKYIKQGKINPFISPFFRGTIRIRRNIKNILLIVVLHIIALACIAIPGIIMLLLAFHIIK